MKIPKTLKTNIDYSVYEKYFKKAWHDTKANKLYFFEPKDDEKVNEKELDKFIEAHKEPFLESGVMNIRLMFKKFKT